MRFLAKVIWRLWASLSILWTLALAALIFVVGDNSLAPSDIGPFTIVIWLAPIGILWLLASLLIWIVRAFDKDGK